MEEKWITMKEATKATGMSRALLTYYIKKGIIEKKQVMEMPRNYINFYSIPTYMREKGKDDR